jgi:hypothetical protein
MQRSRMQERGVLTNILSFISMSRGNGRRIPHDASCPKKIKKLNTNKEAKQIKGKRAGAMFIDCSLAKKQKRSVTLKP